MANFEPVLLKNVGIPDSHTLKVYKERGGYKGLDAALAKAPAEVVQMTKDSALRGRGGAGFPTGVKWTFLPKDYTGPIYLCVNADESEPGTFNNRILMEDDPHQVLEGVMIACYATRATTAYFYIRYEYGHAYRRLQAAIDELYKAKMLGNYACGKKGFHCDIYLHRGAAAYICGEETGLIESLEGKRAWPRIKPPFPAIEGAFRKPTIVNNPETLACLPHIMTRGVSWFKSIGIPADPNNPRDVGSYGPKLYCVSGHVNKPGCYELPLGVTCREVIDVHSGGVLGGKAKAVVPGGMSMGFLTEAELDCKLDFNDPIKYGCLGLGTAALMVVNDKTNIVDVLFNSCRFFSHESCGQCTPCREGTAWMTKILTRIRRGKGELSDIDLLAEVAGNIGTMPGTTICGLADGAAWPVKNAMQKYRQDFVDFINSKKSIVRQDELITAGAH
ncbi:MAG TPA: NADH-quinone oxidoreductase subunit NuoF [Gemmatales bacterium]|nr:NADH-quinone oxidoreductase subunit NuoF [Gemmatales bacterium]